MRYVRRAATVVPCGLNSFWLIGHNGAAVTEIGPEAIDLLRTFRGPAAIHEAAVSHYQTKAIEAIRSLRVRAHSAALRRFLLWLLESVRQNRLTPSRPSQVAAAEQELRRLAALGILVPEEALGEASRDRCGNDRQITTIAVVTKDRPHCLCRCVEALLIDLQHTKCPPAVCVYDDSEDAETRKVLEYLRDRRGKGSRKISYVSPQAKREWARSLVLRGGAPADVVEFAVFPACGCGPAYGANLNAALLTTTGQLLLCLDDDTVLPLYGWPEQDSGLRLGSRAHPSDLLLRVERSDAFASVRPADIDLVTSHLTLLGRPLSQCVATTSGSIDVTGMDPAFVSAVLNRGSCVGVTALGIIGDPGTQDSEWLIDFGSSRRTLFASRDAYRALLRTRQVVRGVRQMTVTAGTFFMNAAAGFDNRQLLPPFLPVMRNTDGVFAVVLRACCPNLHIGYLGSPQQ